MFSIVDRSGFEQYLATTLLPFLIVPAFAFQACGSATALRKSPTAGMLQNPVTPEGERRSLGNPHPLGEWALIATPNLPLSFCWPAQIRSSPWVPYLGCCSWSHTSVKHGVCMHACRFTEIIWILHPFLIFYSSSSLGEAATAFQTIINQTKPNLGLDLPLWLWFKTVIWKIFVQRCVVF